MTPARQPVRLRVLLEQRHWRNHRTFCAEYEKVALSVDPRLRGTAPSRAQLYRWLSGELSGLPYGDHCRVLEKMFPEWSARQLFECVPEGEIPHAMVNRSSVTGEEETLRRPDVELIEENGQLAIDKNCDMKVAGIAKFYPDFIDVGDDWEALFASSPVLDVTIMYGATWRNTYRKHLQTMTRRPEGRIRVILPNPSADSASIQAYARTIGITPDDFRGRVQAAIIDFSSMEPRRHVEVYLTTKVFRHAVYMFADHAVLALYALCGERIPTPALLLAEGEILSFLRVSVVNASQAITDEYYYNENIIDERCFPPHLSLHICTVPSGEIPHIVDELRALIERVGLPCINPIGVESSYGGYVMLNVERTAELIALHEATLELAAMAREGVDFDKYGSKYVRDAFVPHLSLAKVDRRDQANASNIGRQAIGSCQPTRTRALELCDIGAHSERWDVLASFPNRNPQATDLSP